jgi:molybdopterin converting factor small subunit
MQKLDSQTVQLIIVAAVAVTMLLQAIALLAIFGALRKAAQAMRQDIEELRTTVVPVIDNLRDLLVHTGPKIEAAAVDIAAMSHNMRRQTADIQVAANGILDRINKQSLRMDSMLTSIFDGVDRATGLMSDTVTKPMRQVAGLLASAKAVIESLRSDYPPAQASSDQNPGDKDFQS